MKPGATLPPRDVAPPVDDELVGDSSRDPRVTIAVVALTVALGAMVLIRIGHKSLWIDETYTWSTIARPWGSFVHLVRKSESQNLLYTVMMWGWNRIGDTEAWLRFPSAVFAVLTVPSVYLAGKSLFDRKVGLVAATLFVVNANAVQYGQEARAYMMAMLFGSLSIAGFAMIVREPSRRATWLWIVSSALLVYTHPWALFLVGAELASLFFLRPPNGVWRRFRTGIVVIAVVALPAVLLLFSQRSSATNGSLPSFSLSVRYVTGVFGKNGPILVLAWIALLAYGAVATVRAWPRASRARRWQLAAAWSLPIVTLGLVIATDLFLNLLTPAHVATTLPTFAIVGAVALCEIRSTRVFAVALSVLAVLSLIGVVKWHAGEPKQDWRDATAYVLHNASPGDVVVFADDQARIPFSYYSRNSKKLDQLVPGFPSAPWGTWGTGDQKAVLPSSQYLAAIDQAHNTRIWVVAAVAEPGVPGYPERGLNQLYDRLDHALGNHERTSTRAFEGSVSVFRYNPR